MTEEKREKKVRSCDTCGRPGLRRFARAGRTEDYKSLSFVLPESLALIECEGCGERYDAGDDLEVIENFCREQYLARARASIEASLRVLTADRSLAEVERQLGISEGYLSKIKKDIEPSFHLVSLLAVVAHAPSALKVIAALKQGDAPPATAAEPQARGRKIA